MEKSLDIISSTRYAHQCDNPECGKRIPARSVAIALSIKEVINGKKDKIVVYFCDINCFNTYECAIIYAAGAATDSELVFN